MRGDVFEWAGLLWVENPVYNYTTTVNDWIHFQIVFRNEQFYGSFQGYPVTTPEATPTNMARKLVAIAQGCLTKALDRLNEAQRSADEPEEMSACVHGVPWHEACHTGNCFRYAGDRNWRVDWSGHGQSGVDFVWASDRATATLIFGKRRPGLNVDKVTMLGDRQ